MLMKKFFGIMLLLGALGLASCTVAETDYKPTVNVAKRMGTVVIEVGEHPDANPETRVALDGDVTSWEVGDKLAVKYVTAEGVIVPTMLTIASSSDISANGKMARFTGSVEEGEYTKIVALYPGTGAQSSATTMLLSQTDDENIFLWSMVDYTSTPLVVAGGQTSEPVRMQFEHLMHKVDFKFTVSPDINPDTNQTFASDFDASKSIIIELTANSDSGAVKFPLLCSCDLLSGELSVEQSARASTVSVGNHDFAADPVVSMLMFPQQFVNTTFTINVYIDGVKRYHVVKGETTPLNLTMSAGRTTVINLSIDDDTIYEEITEDNPIFGDGSENNPYIIPNFDAMQNFNSMLDNSTEGLAGKYFLQVENFPLSDAAWQPAEKTFNGVYDGNGYTITVGHAGFAGENSGLFYNLGDGAEVENLNIDCEQTQQTGGSSFGILANQTQPGSTIANCHVSGDFSGDKIGQDIYYGGLVGRATGGVIAMSSFTGSLKGDVNNGKGTVGGLVSDIDGEVLIINSFVNGVVANDPGANGNSKTMYVGGFVGSNNGGRIVNCYAKCNMYALSTGSNVGGFIGMNESGSIENCYSDVTFETTSVRYTTMTFVAVNKSTTFIHDYDLTGTDILPYPSWSEGEVSAAYTGVSADVAAALNGYAEGKTEVLGADVVPYSPWTLTQGGTQLELVYNPEIVE